MKRLFANKLFAILLMGFLTACGSVPDYDYEDSSAYGTHETMKVKIVSKRTVTVSKDGIIGKAAGAAIGGVVGASTTDSKPERIVLTIGGAIVGGLVGDAVQKNVSKVKATEYILEKLDGDIIAVVVKDSNLAVGDKAYLIMGERPVLKRID